MCEELPSYQPLKPRLAVRLVRGERGYVVARDRALVLAHQARDRAKVPLRVDGGRGGDGGKVGHPARVVIELRLVDNLLRRRGPTHMVGGKDASLAWPARCPAVVRTCNVLHFCAALNLSFLSFFFRYFRFGASTSTSARAAGCVRGQCAWR